MILITCQPVKGYFMPRGCGIMFIICLCLHLLCCCFLKEFFAQGPIEYE